MTQKALQDSVDRLTTAIRANNEVLAKLAILATTPAEVELDDSGLKLAIGSLESSNKNARSIIDSLTVKPEQPTEPEQPTIDGQATEQPNDAATVPQQSTDPHETAKAL